MVGRFGVDGLRCGVVTASALTAPDCAWGMMVVMLSMPRSMWPPSMLLTTSLVLRNGMCVISVPVASANMTDERCADAGRAVVRFAGIGLEISDEFGHRGDGKFRVDEQ